MSKEIIYFVQNYKPESEAISKEVKILHENFKSKIFNLRTSFPAIISDIIKLLHLKTKGKILHIYTSFGDSVFLPLLKNKERVVLTGSAATSIDKIKERKNQLKKLKFIVSETSRQKETLTKLGFGKKKIIQILPGIKIDEIKNSQKKNKQFKILFASSPPTKEYFESRGIKSMIEAAEKLRDNKFVFLWRKYGYNKLINLIKEKNIKNIIVENKIVKSTSKYYQQADITIAPFIGKDIDKPVPHSIIESLFYGKPVIISEDVHISNIIKKEKCGIVINPKKKDSLIKAINSLEKNYDFYQKNCISTAKKYFSEKKFVSEYKKIYSKM